MTSYIVDEPRALTPEALAEVIALIERGGQVSPTGLIERILAAEQIARALHRGDLVGVAALKNPAPSYRDYVAAQCGVDLPVEAFRYELGWLAVGAPHRRTGIARRLLSMMSEHAKGGFFCTLRADPGWLIKAVTELGGIRLGQTYRSQLGFDLAVYGKTSATP